MDYFNTIKFLTVQGTFLTSFSRTLLLKAVTDLFVCPHVFHLTFCVTYGISEDQSTRQNYTRHNYSKGNYLKMHDFFRDYDQSPVLKDETVDTTTASLTQIVKKRIKLFLPKICSKRSKYPAWFSQKIKILYAKKKKGTFINCIGAVVQTCRTLSSISTGHL